jgi:hypothetical protein
LATFLTDLNLTEDSAFFDTLRLKKLQKFALFGYFEAKRAQNNSKGKIAFYKPVLSVSFATFKGSTLSSC